MELLLPKDCFQIVQKSFVDVLCTYSVFCVQSYLAYLIMLYMIKSLEI